MFTFIKMPMLLLKNSYKIELFEIPHIPAGIGYCGRTNGVVRNYFMV